MLERLIQKLPLSEEAKFDLDFWGHAVLTTLLLSSPVTIALLVALLEQG